MDGLREVGRAPFAARASWNGDVCVVRLAGELDAASSGAAQRLFDDMFLGPTSQVVVDLTDVSFMDASGIELLLHLRDDSPAHVRVGPCSPAVERLLEIVGLSDHLA